MDCAISVVGKVEVMEDLSVEVDWGVNNGDVLVDLREVE